MLRTRVIQILAMTLITYWLTGLQVHADDEAELLAAFRQAIKFDEDGKYAEASLSYEKALKLSLKFHGEDHENSAFIMNNLAETYRIQGKPANAEPLYRRSIAIREKLLGKDHPKVANSLNNLAYLYQDQGHYPAAATLIERSLVIREKALGKNHADVGQSLNSLAEIYRIEGKYKQAEPHYLRSLRIFENTLGKDHPNVAAVLNNLGLLYRNQGDFEQAETYQLRSLKIKESNYGKDHPALASSLNNLAVVYVDLKKYDKAEEAHIRCLKIRTSAFGENHPAVADSLINLGILYSVQAKWSKAEPLFLRGLKIYETILGKDHPALSDSLNNLAALYRDQGDFAKALPLYLRSLKISETVFGPVHPTTARVLLNLSILHVDQEQFKDALRVQTKLRQNSRTFLLRELPTLSTREQLTFISQIETQRFAFALSMGQHLKKDQAAAAQSAEWLLNGKAIALEAQSLNTLLEKQADPALLAKLRDLRSQEAVLALRAGDPKNADAVAKQRDASQAQRRELEKQIAQAGGASASLVNPWIELADVRKAIPTDGILIDIVRFEPARFGAKAGEKYWGAPHYVAWVIPPTGDVKIVDLGEADIIEKQIKAVRETMTAASKLIREIGEPQAADKMNEPLAKLADLVFQPLVPHIGKAKSIILSPDGELWLAPWAALPTAKDRYLIEDYSLHLVVSGRDLLATPLAKKLITTAPLVLADPDFEAAPGKSGAGSPELERSLSQDVALLGEVKRLPGTAAEAEAITPKLKLLATASPILHTDDKATEAIVKAAVRPQILVLSTHGFFMPAQQVENKNVDRLLGESNRASAALTKEGRLVENPLLRCGLLLAGCNKRDRAKTGEDDGVLTGLEIVGTDLRGTQMVVLSACETGLGDVQNGQGVAGLRQAFQLAGAESVVATLWQIPDVQSAQLMVAFFDNLAAKQPRGEALQKAQREMIEKRRKQFGAAHPYYWAAYTLTGQAK